ncbi:hypothetical protein IWZ00DRAFT_511155 [Phyllosticta capitalensis]
MEQGQGALPNLGIFGVLIMAVDLGSGCKYGLVHAWDGMIVLPSLSSETCYNYSILEQGRGPSVVQDGLVFPRLVSTRESPDPAPPLAPSKLIPDPLTHGMQPSLLSPALPTPNNLTKSTLPA